ncbi:GtrA family protein [Ornithinimicrobium cerasi]|uniref:Flippase GtrA (Transmembrane translocase of bactoprenol-linked glucose) n=1 Tax=Ornithinimicrobium cerasi TaxID=2248773 RepID=A0A285VEG3_9MICO|nr:GtrA family protein [Ornithinimicrobium cerasi]SOC52505.1 Putative flippase GtrA (transmembrane translocase of bactoprenol-linked glucose) [Ornithinimicrobium cerasi]
MTAPTPSLLARLRATYEVLVRELAKFGTVGAVAFVVDLVLYNVLVFGVPGLGDGVLHDHPLTGKVVATSTATVVSWLGNRLWTFRHRLSEPMAHEFGLFVLFNAVGLAIALACLAFSRYVLGLDSQLADNISGNGIGLVLGTLFRFWAYRTFVFRGELDAEERLRRAAAREERDSARLARRAARRQGVSASGR